MSFMHISSPSLPLSVPLFLPTPINHMENTLSSLLPHALASPMISVLPHSLLLALLLPCLS